MFSTFIIIYPNKNNLCRILHVHQNHLMNCMSHDLIFQSPLQHLYTMLFLCWCIVDILYLSFKCAFLLIITLTLHAAGTAVVFLALLRRGLERRPPRGMDSLSCNLSSILCRISAWSLLAFSCCCRSFSFSAARLRLLRMSSSKSTTQSSAESGQIMPFASAIVNDIKCVWQKF